MDKKLTPADDTSSVYGKNASSAWPLIFVFIFIFWLAFQVEGTFMVPVIIIGGGFIAVALGYALNRFENKTYDDNRFDQLMKKSEETYKNIISAISNNIDPPEYYVYLRSFKYDNFPIEDYRGKYENGEYQPEKIIPLDIRVLNWSEGENENASLLCIGNDEKTIGIGNLIFGEDEWPDEVERYCQLK